MSKYVFFASLTIVIITSYLYSDGVRAHVVRLNFPKEFSLDMVVEKKVSKDEIKEQAVNEPKGISLQSTNQKTKIDNETVTDKKIHQTKRKAAQRRSHRGLSVVKNTEPSILQNKDEKITTTNNLGAERKIPLIELKVALRSGSKGSSSERNEMKATNMQIKNEKTTARDDTVKVDNIKKQENKSAQRFGRNDLFNEKHKGRKKGQKNRAKDSDLSLDDDELSEKTQKELHKSDNAERDNKRAVKSHTRSVKYRKLRDRRTTDCKLPKKFKTTYSSDKSIDSIEKNTDSIEKTTVERVTKQKRKKTTIKSSGQYTNLQPKDNVKDKNRHKSKTKPTARPLTPKGGSDSDDDDPLSPYSIEQKITDLMPKFPEANMSIVVLGQTAEYNKIVLIKATQMKRDSNRAFRADENKFADEPPEKKIIFIVHGLSVMGFKEINGFVKPKEFVKLVKYYYAHLDKFDIYLIPIGNPDGMAVASNLWNKNNSPQSACPGVALDRNFDIKWNASNRGGSCSQQYPGPHPFSEPETKAIRDVLHQNSHKIVAYIHVHAGTYNDDVFKGDAVLYPKGYTEEQSDDDKYLDIRGEIDEAMKNASFQVISVAVQPLYRWYGKVTGSSVDYASSIYGIPFAMEFVMQPYQIDPFTSDENVVKNAAVSEIWHRVINVTFLQIWKTVQMTNE